MNMCQTRPPNARFRHPPPPTSFNPNFIQSHYHQPSRPPNFQAPIRPIHRTHPNDLGVLSFDGEVEGRLQVDVLQVHVRLAVEDELLGDLDVVVEGGEVEGRVTVVLLLVDDPAAGQLRQEDLHGAGRGRKLRFCVFRPKRSCQVFSIWWFCRKYA